MNGITADAADRRLRGRRLKPRSVIRTMGFSRNRLGLIEDIERVFGDVQRGAGVTLHQARVIDDYGTKEEEAAARALDQEERWQDLPDDLIEDSQMF